MDNTFEDNTFDYALPLVPARKVYTPKMIRVATFLGGPLIAGYLIAENYNIFDDSRKEKMTWVYTVGFLMVLVAVIIFIPFGNNSPKYIIPLLYSWACYSLVQYLQGRSIDGHIKAGGVAHGWGRVILISLIGAVVTAAILIGVLYVALTINPNLLPDK